MANQNNDDLANLLGQMAEGHHEGDEPGQEAEHGADAVDLGASPTPPPTPAAPVTPRMATPVPKPVPEPRPVPTPRAVQPSAPPRPAVAPPKPPEPVAPVVAPEPVAQEPEPEPVTSDAPPQAPEEEAVSADAHAAEVAHVAEVLEHNEMPAGFDDDQVIVPAPPTEALAHTHPPVRKVARPRAKTVSMKMKRTIIPIMLTLGVICLFLVALGLLSAKGSAFKDFASLGAALTFIPVGLVFLAGAVFTMFQVKQELARDALHEQAGA